MCCQHQRLQALSPWTSRAVWLLVTPLSTSTVLRRGSSSSFWVTPACSRELQAPLLCALLLPWEGREHPFPHPSLLLPTPEILRGFIPGSGRGCSSQPRGAELAPGPAAPPGTTAKSPINKAPQLSYTAPAEMGMGQESPKDSLLYISFHKSVRVPRCPITTVFHCLQSVSVENVPIVIKWSLGYFLTWAICLHSPDLLPVLL